MTSSLYMKIITVALLLVVVVHGNDSTDAGKTDMPTCAASGCAAQAPDLGLSDETSLLQSATIVTSVEDRSAAGTTGTTGTTGTAGTSGTTGSSGTTSASGTSSSDGVEVKGHVLDEGEMYRRIANEEELANTVHILASGCVDGFDDEGNGCGDNSSTISDPSATSPDIPVKEVTASKTAGSAGASPAKLFSSEPTSPFAIPPTQKIRKLYTWDDHMALPIHQRINVERHNGTIGFMRGVALKSIHKNVELMDTTWTLLDVHDIMSSTTKLKESQFPVTLVFRDREDPVKVDGGIDWKIVFDAQIEAAKIGTTAAKTELADAKAKYEGNTKAKAAMKAREEELKALTKRDNAEFDGEKKQIQQITKTRELQLEHATTGPKSLNHEQVQKLALAIDRRNKDTVDNLAARRESAMDALKAASAKGELQALTDKVKKAKANEEWMQRLQGILVPKMEGDSKFKSFMKEIFLSEDQSAEKLSKAVSEGEGVDAIKDKGIVEEFFTYKIEPTIGGMCNVLQKNAMTYINGWLDTAKEILVGVLVTPVALVPFVGGFLAVTLTMLLNFVFEYVSKVIDDSLDHLCDYVKEKVTDKIVGLLMKAYDDKMPITIDETALQTAITQSKTGVVDKAQENMNKGLEEAKGEGGASSAADILATAEKLGSEADDEAQADRELWETLFESQPTDLSCAQAAPKDSKGVESCSEIKVLEGQDKKIECPKYYKASDKDKYHLKPGQVVQCVPIRVDLGIGMRSPCKANTDGPFCYKQECADTNEPTLMGSYTCQTLQEHCGQKVRVSGRATFNMDKQCPRTCGKCPGEANPSSEALDLTKLGCLGIIGGGNVNQKSFQQGDDGSTFPNCKCLADDGGRGNRKFEFRLYAGDTKVSTDRKFNMNDPAMKAPQVKGKQLRCQAEFPEWPAGNNQDR